MVNFFNQNGINNLTDTFIDRVNDFTEKTVQAVVGMVSGESTWFSRRVKNWTQETFRPSIAETVYSVIMALPFFAVHTLLPYPLNLTIMSIALIWRIGTIIKSQDQPADELKEMISHIFDPISNAMGTVYTAQGVHGLAMAVIQGDLFGYYGSACTLGLGIVTLNIRDIVLKELTYFHD